jgi:hypothetical protein
VYGICGDESLTQKRGLYFRDIGMGYTVGSDWMQPLSGRDGGEWLLGFSLAKVIEDTE